MQRAGIAREERAARALETVTLRDHFAGLALQGMLANARDYADLMAAGYAEQAYLHADAMIAAREVKS